MVLHETLCARRERRTSARVRHADTILEAFVEQDGHGLITDWNGQAALIPERNRERSRRVLAEILATRQRKPFLPKPWTIRRTPSGQGVPCWKGTQFDCL